MGLMRRGSALRFGVLGGAQIAVGAAAIFARFALTGAEPLAAAALRLAIATAAMWVITLIAPPPKSDSPNATQRWIFILAGFALAAHFATWIWSLEYTTVAISTLLVATTPVWTALYESVVQRRALSVWAWAAMAAGGAGVFLIAGYTGTAPPHPGHRLLGDLLAIIGAIAIGAYFLLIREVREAYGTREIVRRTYAWGALFLIAASAVTRQTPPAFSAGTAWGGIIAMAFISQLLGHTGMNAALRWFSASAVAFSTLIEPVIAALLALAIFREGLSGSAIAGGLLVLVAVGVFLREEV